MAEQERVVCETHGKDRVATFVCRHLAQNVATKMLTDEMPTDDNPWPDAYCGECAAFRDSHGGEWNEESEAFADVMVLCDGCYQDRRAALTG